VSAVRPVQPPHVLSIDLGTGGPKVALVGVDGSVAAAATRPVETVRIPPDGAEQDPEAIWEAAADAVREVLWKGGVPVEAIAGVSLASQFSSLVPVDAEGRPVGALILWMDGRGAAAARRLHAAHPEAGARWLEVHGLFPLPSGSDSLSHLLWLREARPEVYGRARAFLEPVDYLAARMTGRCTANPCSAFLLLLTDNRRLDAVAWDEELLALAELPREKLPELVPVSSVVGTLRPDVARELGLSPRTPVFSGVNDTQAVAVATGSFLPGVGGVNSGTTSQVLAHVGEKRSDLGAALVSAPAALPGRYVVIAENGLGARTLDHFLREVAFTRDALADHRSADPFAGVDAAALSAPAGAGGLLFLPWLTGTGAPSADAHVRGAFLNVGLGTTRSHLVRAILEGVAMSLRWLLPEVERFAATRFEVLRFAGGAAVSDAWSQILADVLGRPVEQLADARHAINRATALLAFERLGLLGLGGLSRLCPVKREWRPREENHAVHDRLFTQFLAALEASRPVFRALNP
jgi:xylulokinase